MSKQAIAVVVNNDNQGVNAYETIDAIVIAGFQNVFIQWYHKAWTPSQEEQLRYIREKGLHILFAHLGYRGINDLWVEGPNGDALVENYKKDLETCKQNDILTVCMHLTSKQVAPPYGEIGLRRIREIVDYAQTLGIRVAFENTKIKGYLEYVIEHLNHPNVGICFDSGHYHAHFQDDWDLRIFQDRIFCVHLHDNDGTADQHLFPFDGTLDWKDTLSKLKSCGYHGPITMELCYRNEYEKMSMEAFYQKGYEIGQKLAALAEER